MHNLVSDSKSTFRGRFEVEIGRKAPFWKAESLRNPISKELAPEDTSISRNGRFESDHFDVKIMKFMKIIKTTSNFWKSINFI